MDNNSPVIIIGMHRSGTTMLAGMLRELGLFMGRDLESNAESKFFIQHNDWLLSQCGGAWHNPKAMDWLLSNEEIFTLSLAYLRVRLNAPPIARYLGWKRFLSGQRPLGKMGPPWGWKDPRTTFTLPLWRRLFPEARIVHIVRNGVPVAASLRARARKALNASKAKYTTRRQQRSYRFREKKGGYVGAIRCLDLDGGFSLWEEYLTRALEMLREEAPGTFTLKYENFLADPTPHLKDLAAFCGLDAPDGKIETIVSTVRKDRANAFLKDEALSRYYHRMKETPLMTSLGYDIPPA